MLWTQRLRRSTEEFWSLTYREIYACIDDYFSITQSEQRAWNVRIGTVCATIRNRNPFAVLTKPAQWTDFFQDNMEGATAPAGPKKLNETTKIRFRQLASYWKMRREKDGQQ